jgi:6-pyruvoyltetrahydropterin/6-carboxytetrahydropterin synthase
MIKTTAERHHDFSAGHRVSGHENKCKHLHGHNYRVTFFCKADELDEVGRVIDFGVIKSKLCNWLEDNWDHKMLIWCDDELLPKLKVLVPQDIVEVQFNPTAENMAQYLIEVVGPYQLKETGVRLVKCIVSETRKCSATCQI